MGATQIDLFRSGNATSAQLARLRLHPTVPDPDVETYTDPSSSDEWVKASSGGVSTWEQIDPSWRGRPWRLPYGAQYPDELRLSTDAPGHWLWEPSRDMPLAEYVAALEAVNAQFQRV